MRSSESNAGDNQLHGSSCARTNLLPLTEERCDELHLTTQVADNTSYLGTAFTVSIDARLGVTTGISAADRATTIRVAVDPSSRPQDLARPGHVFPLRAKNGGVLVRPGQTEASVDIARMAGLYPAGVICEIMNEDGTMARLPQLEAFAAQHNLNMITVADLVRYRISKEKLVRRVVETDLPTVYGRFRRNRLRKCHQWRHAPGYGHG